MDNITRLFRSIAPFFLVMPTVGFGSIADAPLQVNSSVKPNIFFMLDDSLSMAWSVVHSNEAKELYSVLAKHQFDYWWRGQMNAFTNPLPSDRSRMLNTCPGYNKLYYDPNVTYIPWSGQDKKGRPFANQPITAARLNPYDPATVINLTKPASKGYLASNKPWKEVDVSRLEHGYSIWADDGDGVFERGECPDPGMPGYNYSKQFVTVRKMSPAQRTNFANWYSYYRNREQVMKKAMLSVVSDSEERLGFSTLNRNGIQGFPVADMSLGTHKAKMLSEILKSYPGGGTPLRRKLAQVGAYFEGKKPQGLFYKPQVSPILNKKEGGECQQNFAILLSDGFWNGPDPSPKVGNADSGNKGDGDQNDTEFDGASYADNKPRQSNTLADVAMHFYERDLNSALDNKVPTSQRDSNNQQHLVTYTVAFGINGMLDSSPSEEKEKFAWPNVTKNTPSTIDDMRHAAWNGRGEFLSARSPGALETALKGAINSITARTSSAASLATNDTRLGNNTNLYQVRFNTTNWAGELLAYRLDPLTGDVKKPLWNSADLIPTTEKRKVYTSDQSVASGVAFSWGAAASVLSAAGLDETMVNYLRGDRSLEADRYRKRQSLLGDIVNSQPIYTQNESVGFFALETRAGKATYDDYLAGKDAGKGEKGGRPGVIYAGANDGMLHAFLGTGVTSPKCDPDTQACEGKELFSYIPRAVHEKLKNLTYPDYTHRFYVNNPVTLGDAFVRFEGAPSDNGGRWGSALIGTLGAGGKGVFALDISNPAEFGASDVLWDYTNKDIDPNGMSFADLGYTFASPAIVKLKSDGGTHNNDWGVVLGNGYGSRNGQAVLYIIGLKTGEVIWKHEVGEPGNNGLSTPAVVDTNRDSIADTIYAGDLKGNLWKFDISSSEVSKWDGAFKQGRKTVPLFRACTDNPCRNPQPITTEPVVVRAKSGGLMVLFGTGKYFEEGDDTDSSQVQSFYGIRDNARPVTGRIDLQRQEITYEALASQTGYVSDVRTQSDYPVNYNRVSGWYLDFNSPNYPGERVIADALLQDEKLFINTLIPNSEVCEFGGKSWRFAFDPQSGRAIKSGVFDLNGDGKIDQDDWVDTDGDGKKDTAATAVKSEAGLFGSPTFVETGNGKGKLYNSNDRGGVDPIVVKLSGKPGRQSWLQIR